MPYILDRGYTKIDMIVVSHFDTDHMNALCQIMKNLKVKNVIIGKQFEDSENLQEFLKIVKEKNVKVNVVEAGDKISIEKNLYFHVLWPDSSNIISEKALNNNALVCKLCYKNFSMLFTGDIEEATEKGLIKKYGDTKVDTKVLNSTVLKVAHHGSKTSSIKEFVNLVKPKIAVIGVGKNNLYGHPSSEVIERLSDMRGENF